MRPAGLFKRVVPALGSERGSIFPLVLGCFVGLGVLVLACIEVTSLFLSQKRLESAAEQGAYVAASGFYLGDDSDVVVTQLSVASASDNVEWFLAEGAADASLSGLWFDEDSTVHVTLATTWSPVLLPSFFGVELQLSAERNSRSLLTSE